MSVLSSRVSTWPALAALGWCALTHAGVITPAITDMARSLDQVERLRTTDHPRFVQMLARFHSKASSLTPAEQWHLRYLDAWEIMYEGHDTQAAARLRDVIDHSGDAVLATKASALLLSNLGFNRHYEEAYELANRLATGLPA